MSVHRQPLPVDRQAQLADKIFERSYLRPGRPVVISTPMPGWTCYEKWQFDYLRETVGAVELPMPYSDDGRFKADTQRGLARLSRKLPVSDFIETLRAGCAAEAPVVYLSQIDIDAHLPRLVDDITPWPYYLPAKVSKRRRNLWIGPAEAETPLHFDRYENLLCQISGRKRVTLCAPGELRHLYPYPARSKTFHMSRVDALRPDFEKFPRSRALRTYEAVLGPGDSLFIPAFWWHQVRILETGISINHWWRPESYKLLCRPGLHILPQLLEDKLRRLSRRIRAGFSMH